MPISYLGVPLGGKPSSMGFWENICEKIKKNKQTNSAVGNTPICPKVAKSPLLTLLLKVSPHIRCLSSEPPWVCAKSLRNIGEISYGKIMLKEIIFISLDGLRLLFLEKRVDWA